MAQQIINVGVSADDGSGDPLRAAGNKINANFTELYTLRPKLLEADTYLYVDTTGSDSNNGLSPITPFLTIQKAVNVACGYASTSAGTIKIQLAAGTYSQSQLTLRRNSGTQPFVIIGSVSTPASYIIECTGSSHGIVADAMSYWSLQGVTLTYSGSGSSVGSLFVCKNSCTSLSNVVFTAVSALTSAHAKVEGGQLFIEGNYTIAGGAPYHFKVKSYGVVHQTGYTVTVTGTPAFTTFADVETGLVNSASAVYSGGATGARYAVSLNGVINTNGGGASYFPGNSVGSAATGGVYA